MTDIKSLLAALLIAGSVAGGSYYGGYLRGWYAHSDKVNLDYANRKQQAENNLAKKTAQSQQVRVVTETKYKTIYRDVVKYVQNTDRTVCDFDDDYVRLRQSAIDADSAIKRDAGRGVRIVESSTKE